MRFELKTLIKYRKKLWMSDVNRFDSLFVFEAVR